MNIKDIHKSNPDGGFTLIEIIITIVVGAILSVFVVQVMASVIYGSPESLNSVEDEADAENIMEEIIADYVKEINENPDNALHQLKNINSYGSEVTMEYVEFDAGGSMQPTAPDTSGTLRVTVELNGHRLEILLTECRKNEDDIKIRY